MRIQITHLAALLSGLALARGAAVVTRSADDACADSAKDAYWRVEDFTFIIYDWDYGGTNGTFDFTSFFSGTDTTLECTARNVDFAALEHTWATCGDNAEAQFQFSSMDLTLSLKNTWSCPSAPETVYTANANTHLMMHGCIDTETDRGLESDCYLMETDIGATSVTTAAQS